MWTLRAACATFLMLVLLGMGNAPCVFAQPVTSFPQIGLQLNVGDRVTVIDTAGGRAEGRLAELGRDSLVLDTPDGTRRVPSTTLRSVTVRTRHIRRSLLIGAGAGALVGAIAACAGSDRSECADGPLMAGAAGAGIGALVGSLLASSRAVYSAGGADSEPLVSAVNVDRVVEVLARVNLDDQIRIESSERTPVIGTLRGISDDSLRIATTGGEVRIPSAQIQRVSVRRYQPARGALIGAAAFAVAALASPSCRDNDACSPLIAAPFGAGIGLAIGALIPHMVTVFPARTASVSFSPALSRAHAALSASIRW